MVNVDVKIDFVRVVMSRGERGETTRERVEAIESEEFDGESEGLGGSFEVGEEGFERERLGRGRVEREDYEREERDGEDEEWEEAFFELCHWLWRQGGHCSDGVRVIELFTKKNIGLFGS